MERASAYDRQIPWRERRRAVIFVDTNVLMYAVGRPHPLRQDAQQFFIAAAEDDQPLVTSVEVLQELLHAYLPVGRLATLDAAFELVGSLTDVWSLDRADVELARALVSKYPRLSARDLTHVASCQRRGVSRIHTYDHALATALGREQD